MSKVGGQRDLRTPPAETVRAKGWAKTPLLHPAGVALCWPPSKHFAPTDLVQSGDQEGGVWGAAGEPGGLGPAQPISAEPGEGQEAAVLPPSPFGAHGWGLFGPSSILGQEGDTLDSPNHLFSPGGAGGAGMPPGQEAGLLGSGTQLFSPQTPAGMPLAGGLEEGLAAAGTWARTSPVAPLPSAAAVPNSGGSGGGLPGAWAPAGAPPFAAPSAPLPARGHGWLGRTLSPAETERLEEIRRVLRELPMEQKVQLQAMLPSRQVTGVGWGGVG